MKKVPFFLLALTIVFSGVALAVPSDDSTGPEGPNENTPINNPYFDILTNVVQGPGDRRADPTATRDRFDLRFPLTGTGWDFGDRVAYTCAWVEWFQGQNEKVEIAFHGVGDYPGFFQLNDKYGAEIPDGTIMPDGRTLNDWCLDESGVTRRADFRWDGSDHFPHMIHPGDGIDIYQDGEIVQHLELSTGACEKLYPVPGDEPGEVWLWWDEDGPTFSHGPGDGDLGCNGGPVEPVAVMQIEPRFADPDIGYCTHSAHEELCFNVEPPPTPVTLGEGASVLTCPGGATPAVESTEPLVVRC